VEVEHTNVRFLGNLVLNLWDCGGQYQYIESYFDNDSIFINAEVLIYVFDIDSADLHNDLSVFSRMMDSMERCSPDASIFILIHKMDLVPEDDRKREFEERSKLVKSQSEHFELNCFPTSIWDETLYKAWSEIVHSLIPNVKLLKAQLTDFSAICAADEVVLFERATFLVISHVSTMDSGHYDDHRFERISNIIKQFKISCSKSMSQFEGMEVRNSQFTAFIDMFTVNTYIMVIMTGANAKISTTLTQLNISAARKHFESFIPENA